MIKNTCPNAGTPSAGLAGEAETSPEDAGLAGAAAAPRPAASAITGASKLPILVRAQHPRLPRHATRSRAVSTQRTSSSISHLPGRVQGRPASPPTSPAKIILRICHANLGRSIAVINEEARPPHIGRRLSGSVRKGEQLRQSNIDVIAKHQ